MWANNFLIWSLVSQQLFFHDGVIFWTLLVTVKGDLLALLLMVNKPFFFIYTKI